MWVKALKGLQISKGAMPNNSTLFYGLHIENTFMLFSNITCFAWMEMFNKSA